MNTTVPAKRARARRVQLDTYAAELQAYLDAVRAHDLRWRS